ncbi:four helix bundle protein [Candidatus Roizmanbacteria bacterium CG02_land_8_20_14_3_00_36_15]|uniref:Four helix bundle protein n=2 Tax=Candidatus Roizmaniibacteriota TaxID=1752723 RepID=A0A2M8KLG0_9BACT|nr:MAG: four helix bundle protein [Candidatus Roizmanbacteria bacterium CG03_land_8_20_14_0_80_36_21]PIV37718.1 MAG: four helix bundle protein [Candidatus Roizmanbacteria bacterium CG02_land_8_20_14_3_00_36_15]PIY69675.1 MAG: four helix bundle protein [Candidatus Roizmanbacteria bacterium CG_4_10_14_0_8_um_filter_36_36]PJA53548.1 MAG: four helix bundle protein [Candidatus Roizmanbacteria bacterium CG_4_9_14_3_um_filter_36_11]PJC81826.1 MAG: four helix bundle protein [Candidatus Roizmanbacteria 
MQTNEDFKQQLINRTLDLARKTISLVDKFPSKRSAWVISDQLIRASTSIGANIIEAQAASSRRDFINFLNHALKSGNETKFWFVLSKDLNQKLIKEVDVLLNETKELTKILGSSIMTLKNKNKYEKTFNFKLKF